MRIGFTGSQKGMTKNQRVAFKSIACNSEIKEFHHGDCVGADAQAHTMMAAHGICKKDIHIHPAIIHESKKAGNIWGILYAPKLPLERNKDIVNASDILVAAPATKTEVVRSGTWSTIRYARKRGVPIIILEP
jgi:hypothetical protein